MTLSENTNMEIFMILRYVILAFYLVLLRLDA